MQKLNKEVVIGGVSYKTSSNKLTKAGTSSIKQQSGRAMKSLPTRTIGEPLVKVKVITMPRNLSCTATRTTRTVKTKLPCRIKSKISTSVSFSMYLSVAGVAGVQLVGARFSRCATTS